MGELNLDKFERGWTQAPEQKPKRVMLFTQKEENVSRSSFDLVLRLRRPNTMDHCCPIEQHTRLLLSGIYTIVIKALTHIICSIL